MQCNATQSGGAGMPRQPQWRLGKLALGKAHDRHSCSARRTVALGSHAKGHAQQGQRAAGAASCRLPPKPLH